MNLGEILDILAGYDEDRYMRCGFTNPHSYRGYYDRLGLEVGEPATVRQAMILLRGCLNFTFTGWKGGDYRYGLNTLVHLANEGTCFQDDEPITLTQLRWLIEG